MWKVGIPFPDLVAVPDDFPDFPPPPQSICKLTIGSASAWTSHSPALKRESKRQLPDNRQPKTGTLITNQGHFLKKKHIFVWGFARGLNQGNLPRWRLSFIRTETSVTWNDLSPSNWSFLELLGPFIIGFLRGGCPRGGVWGTLRIPREDWGTLGKIRGITTVVSEEIFWDGIPTAIP